MQHFENLLDLIDLERDAEKEENKRELERYPLQVREALGKTVTRLQIDDEDVGVGGIPLLILSRAPRSSPTLAKRAMGSEGGLSPFHAMNQGDNVLVTFPAAVKLKPMEGTLYDVGEFSVTVATNGRLPDPLPKGSCQLDMLGSDATYKRMRQALNQLIRTEEPNLVRLRDVFLGEKKPALEKPGKAEKIRLFNTRLNKFQIDAVHSCLAAHDGAVVHGPPGTGKTTVLVEIIVQAVKRGARVLATAPSNIAVDNMVEKLLPWNLRIVRMGHPARIMEPLRHVTLAALEEEHDIRHEIQRLNDERHRLLTQLRRKSERGRGIDAPARREILAMVQKLGKEAQDHAYAIRRQIFQSAQVVLSTHGGTTTSLGKQKFDVVVLDEASQATEPLSWIPLTLGKKAVFAGDSHQLPPTIYSKVAAERGLSIPLFDRLQKVLPAELQTLLRVQYRMHEDIMNFSSRHFYEGKLIADDAVRRHTMNELPGVKKSPLTEAPVVFIDTAGTGYEEMWNELLESRENEGEAGLAVKVLEKLESLGVSLSQIAIITPYVAQVKRLRLLLQGRGVEIGSVDSFQGREKEAVILSLVRSNAGGEVGFLNDTRRMNVGMTRARRLLIVIGDSSTIGQHPFYGSFLDYVDELKAHESAWDWMEA